MYIQQYTIHNGNRTEPTTTVSRRDGNKIIKWKIRNSNLQKKDSSDRYLHANSHLCPSGTTLYNSHTGSKNSRSSTYTRRNNLPTTVSTE